jgi:hypothetical protein
LNLSLFVIPAKAEIYKIIKIPAQGRNDRKP